MNKPHLIALLLSTLLLGACSPETEDRDNDDHIWKTQTDALKQAQQLQGTLDEETRRKEKQLEEIER